MKNRILSAAIALSMLAAQVPMASLAEDVSMSEEELIAALDRAEAGETIELTGSVELTRQLVIEKEVVLDGNGYTIKKGESEDVSPNNAGILVTSGATLRDLTVEGPNTNPAGWDEGEFGIKFYQAEGAQLQDVTVEQANAGIQVNGGSVAMSGTIDVSGNEFGGIEVCREAELDLTEANLVNSGETKETPTLWNDSGKGTIRANENQHLYIWTEYASGKDHLYLNQANLGVEAQVEGAAYETLAQALEAAGESDGDKTVTLLKDVTVSSGEQAESRISGAVLTLPAGVTLDGRGYTVAYEGDEEIGVFLAVDGAGGTIRDTRFVTNGKAQHVLSFTETENARLEGVTIQGGQEAAVLVNSASVVLENTSLQPEEGAQANIVYKADSKLPSLTLNHVEASSNASLLYISRETLEQLGSLDSAEEVEQVLEQIQASISGDYPVELTYDEESGSVSAPVSVPYAITLEQGENGTLSADHTEALPGTVITLTVTPGQGYKLKKLEVVDEQNQAVEITQQEDGSYTFEMPESPVVVSVSFVRENSGSGGGSGGSGGSGGGGSSDNGDDSNGGNGSGGEDEETPGQEPDVPTFQDVDESDWFYHAVQFVAEKGIMSGVEENRFAPRTALTRAMLAQILYAMESKPEMDGNGAFSDVEESAWYASAVAWAAENGLVSGVGEDRFAPNDLLTREQMALILYRYAQYKGYEIQVDGEPLERFQDQDEISSWAVEAMAWAVDAGLLSGTGSAQLSPVNTASRAEVAQVLANFCQTVV